MPKEIPLAIFDIVLIIVILVGIWRGRKRGISNELLDVLEWIGIVVGAGLGYPYVGGLLVRYANVPNGFANVLGYLIIAAVILAIFKSIKRAVGEKLVQGDSFGRFEFYLGMIAGAIRFACILLFVLALLHSKYSTAEARAAYAKLQQDNLGSISFPTLDGIQQSVFYESYSGNFIRTNLAEIMIQPSVPGRGHYPGEGLKRRRQRNLDEVLGGSK